MIPKNLQNRVPPWTPAEDETLRRMWPDNLGLNIAEALGRPAHQIYNRAKELGLPKKPMNWRGGNFTPERDALLRSLWATHSLVAIVQRLGPGFNLSNVRRRGRQIGLPQKVQPAVARLGYPLAKQEEAPAQPFHIVHGNYATDARSFAIIQAARREPRHAPR